MSNSTTKRVIKSFVRREGKITTGQKNALEKFWPQYGLEVSNGLTNLREIFGNANPCICEIGFGMGESLLEMATLNQDKNYIGVEVYSPGVGSLLRNIANNKLTNIKVYQADAIDVLNNCIQDNSLTGVQLFFPDPWHKKRHYKRRLVQVDFVELILHKLQNQGFFHIATDWQNYAEHVLEIMGQVNNFKNTHGDGNYATEQLRPITKFENRGKRLGHNIYDIVFIKQIES